MKPLKTLLASILLLTGVLIGSSVSRVPVALATNDEWEIVSTPNVADVNNVLQEVAVIDDSHIWAVGYSQTTGSNGVQTALAMHYDGSSWSITSMTISGSYSSSLYGVAASSSADVWAVGEYATSSTAQNRTLIMHWDGSAWDQVSSPYFGDGDNVLNAVAVVDEDNAWAVGSYDDSGVTYSLTEQWDGSSWSRVSSPSPSGVHNILYGVAAIAADDVWASGIYNDDQDVHTEFLIHWNGSGWTRYDGPRPGRAPNVYKIGAVATDDIWVVGYFNDTGLHYGTLTEHWNGTSWSYVSSPNHGTGTNVLWAVAPVESEAVWTVGYWNNNSTLTEYWDGTEWSYISSPNVGSGTNRLFGVSTTDGSVVSGYNAWAVGFSTDTSGLKQTLAMVYHHPGVSRP